MRQYDFPDFVTSYNDFANFFNVYTLEDGSRYFNMSKSINFENMENISPNYYFAYSIEDKDTWPLIAHSFYGDTTLWWLVCKFNNIIDPTEFPEAGTIIKLPTDTLVKAIVGDIRSE